MDRPWPRRRELQRLAALAHALAGTVLWLSTFYWIAQLPEGDGSGMQWAAAMPLSMIFFLFSLPALVLALKGKSLVTALVLGALGLAAFTALFLQLRSEAAEMERDKRSQMESRITASTSPQRSDIHAHVSPSACGRSTRCRRVHNHPTMADCWWNATRQSVSRFT